MKLKHAMHYQLDSQTRFQVRCLQIGLSTLYLLKDELRGQDVSCTIFHAVLKTCSHLLQSALAIPHIRPRTATHSLCFESQPTLTKTSRPTLVTSIMRPFVRTDKNSKGLSRTFVKQHCLGIHVVAIDIHQ